MLEEKILNRIVRGGFAEDAEIGGGVTWAVVVSGHLLELSFGYLSLLGVGW
jgi:hypothetical protein